MKKLPVLWFVLGLCTLAAGLRAADAPFDFDMLRYRAKLLAAKPY